MLEPFSIHLLDHILFVLLGVVLPLRTMGAQKKLKGVEFDSRLRIALFVGNTIGLWVMALTVIALWWWLGRPWGQLGLQWTPAAVSFWSLGLTALFFLIYLADAMHDIFSVTGRIETQHRLSEELALLPRRPREYLYFIPLAFSAGICEEIVFRGFFITYLVSLTGTSIWGYMLAIGLPAIIFGAVHIYQGRAAVWKITIMAVIFGVAYALTASILLLIILHVLVDLIGGSIGLWLPEPEPEPDPDDWTSESIIWQEEE